MKRSPTIRKPHLRGLSARLLLATAFLGVTCFAQTAWSGGEVETAIAATEKSLYEGRFHAALEQYRNLLNSLLGAKSPATEKRRWMPEVDLALRRTATLGQQLGRSGDIAPLLSAWSAQLASIDPVVRARAAYHAGWSIIEATFPEF